MNEETPPSINTNASEADWALAVEKFEIIRPFLDEGAQLTKISVERNIPIRTMRRWVSKYKSGGIPNLVNKKYSKRKKKVSRNLNNIIEGLALKTPPLSAASIHRYLINMEAELGEEVPTYQTIYRIIKNIPPSLMTLAHEGKDAYTNKYDLVHRSEAEHSNAIWQADHCFLDVLIKDKEQLKKPWLTVIMDDYSRCITGYSLYFSAPSSVQTALALRQAVWYKSDTNWKACGIPDVLYVDHGSDFTSKHMEELAINIKTRLVFSTAGQPRGRGKIERFFRSLQQVLLPTLPGHQPPGQKTKTKKYMTLSQLAEILENFIVNDYHQTDHSSTKEAPIARWGSDSFLPRLPDSKAELDILMLTVSKSRVVHTDGVMFSGFRYISPTLAGYIGESSSSFASVQMWVMPLQLFGSLPPLPRCKRSLARL